MIPRSPWSQKSLDNERVDLVRDNGMGIPEDVVEQVFNPFFTTKPTGEGTGLGLSLVMILSAEHNGEFSVDSVENEYAEFKIIIPVNL